MDSYPKFEIQAGRVDEMCAYMGKRVPHQDEMVLIKKHELDDLKSAAVQEMRLPKGSVGIDETYLKTLHHGVIERDAFQIKSLFETMVVYFSGKNKSMYSKAC